MPHKLMPPCKLCTAIAVKHGYCADHQSAYNVSNNKARPSASAQGYDVEWRRLRETVLEQWGIPREEWPLYDVHHTPPYNPSVEPDHRKYTLTPILHSEHSRISLQARHRKAKA